MAEPTRSNAGMLGGEYVTEAPPADILAEALSAGAAASNAQASGAASQIAAIGGRASSTGARVRKVSSAASDSSGGLSPLSRVDSHDSLAGRSAGQGGIGVITAKQRLAQSQSPGRSVALQSSAAQPVKTRLRPPSGSRGSSAQPPAPVVSTGAPPSPPRLRGGTIRPPSPPSPQSVAQSTAASTSTRPNSKSVDALSDDAAKLSAGVKRPEQGTQATNASPERAAALARRVAREAAGRRVVVMQKEFRALQKSVPVSVREVCIATCLAPMLQDACPSARHEAIVALAAFAQRAVHESGVIVAACASLVDFATGGSCLRRALRIPGNTAGSVISATGVHASTTPGLSHNDPVSMPTSGGIRSSAVRRQQDGGSRARFNLLSRVFGVQPKSEATGGPPLVPPQAHTPPVPSPLSRGGLAPSSSPPIVNSPAYHNRGSSDSSPQHVFDLSALGLPDGLLTLQSVSAAMLAASEVYRLAVIETDSPLTTAQPSVTMRGGAVEASIGHSWLASGVAGERDSVIQVRIVMDAACDKCCV
jgi:hypothetical protein